MPHQPSAPLYVLVEGPEETPSCEIVASPEQRTTPSISHLLSSPK